MVDFLGGGVAVGDYPAFLTEACEYVESFLTLRPTCVLINNIDDDHLDYYKDINHIYSAFEKFVTLMPNSGTLFAGVHDPLVKKLAASCGRRTVTYGFEGADYIAANEEYDDMGCGSFDAVTPDGTVRVRLSVVGRHNISNTQADIAV